MTSPEEPKPERTRVYVCGHRNPDTDSIAAAIGYAELKNHLDDAHQYVPVRLGVANAQTTWLVLVELVDVVLQLRVADRRGDRVRIGIAVTADVDARALGFAVGHAT